MTKTPSCDEPEHDESCLCHAPWAEHEATQDHELPAARGGVEGDHGKARRPRADRTALKGEA